MTKIFLSYSHQDEAWKNKLTKHLNVLTRAGIEIDTWDDRRIQGGDDWQQEIQTAIECCDIALLLVSADFLTSNFILGQEVPPLLERKAQGSVRVIPIIVSACQWEVFSWLSPVQARPVDGKPLNKLGKAKVDEVLSKLAGEIHQRHQKKAALPPVETTPASAPSAPPAPLPVTPDPFPRSTAPHLATPLYGRRELLARMAEGLATHDVLALYGFRGNGKSELIKQMQRHPPAHLPAQWVRVDAANETTAAVLFNRLADALGDRADRPVPPTGSVEEMANQLRERYREPQPVVVWVDKAHFWFERGTRWVDEDLAKLFRALRKALGSRWRWVLELREQPGAALQGAGVLPLEVPGIDRAGLAEWLQASAPAGQEAAWRYSGDELKRLYQWLGNRRDEDRSQAANPMATRLLIEVARARQVPPRKVLDQLLGQVEQRVDEALLGDLYRNVLNETERELLNALALYRDAVPFDHIERLEQALAASGCWDGLERRCMLAGDVSGERFFLHGFVAGWVRHQLGYPSADDLWIDSDLPDNLAPAQREHLQHLHAAVAECWLQQLGRSRRLALPNLQRAREAFHHALSAGQVARLGEIAVELFGGYEAQVLRRLWEYYTTLFRKDADRAAQITVLQLITQLDAYDHKAWRFLGENLRRTGASHERVLHCFETALAANPSFPPYLANLGNLLLKQGPTGAEAFLHRLAQHRQQHPEAVDEHVLSVQAQCLQIAHHPEQASQLRREQIQAGSHDPAFYNDEASDQLVQGHPEQALHWLNLARQRGVENGYTLAIQTKALEACGRGSEASQLRREQIEAGSRNPAFYADEANYQLTQGHPEQALHWLNLARQRGVGNGYTLAIQTKALEACGRGGEASKLRREHIEAGSRNPVFYNDEANYQLAQGYPEQALHWLNLARQRGAESGYTLAIQTKALEACGLGGEASQLRREQIEAGSRDPAFYNDEANYQLAQGHPEQARRWLEQAERLGIGNEATRAIRAKVDKHR